jgi:TldD protein
MLNEIQKQIERIKAKGATYVDSRWYPSEDTNYLMMLNGNLKTAGMSGESGVGIRILYKGAWGFSASSDVSSLPALYDKAFDNARIAAERVTFPVRLAEKDIIQAKFESPCKINPFDVPLAEKVAFLKEMDEKLDQSGVFQRVSSLAFVRKQIVFVDSEGSQIEKLITEVFAGMEVLGQDKQGGSQERKFRLSQVGDSRGWESIDSHLFQENAERIVRELNQVLVAEDCPKDDP